MNTIRSTLFAVLVTCASGCAIPGRGEPIEQENDTSTPDIVTDIEAGDLDIDLGEVDEVEPPVPFAGAVHDLLVSSCTSTGCHASGAGGYALSGDVDADYEATLKVVVPFDAAASKLIKKTSGVTSHTGGPLLSEGTAEYDLIVEWIDDGANP